MTSLSREFRFYLAVWRKAYRERLTEEPEITLNASSFSMALAIRQGMYRAIRPYRTGREIDDELLQASQLFVVSSPKGSDPKEPHTLTIKPRATLSELEANLLFLGMNEDDLATDGERHTRMELEKLIEAPEKPVTRSNPFYSREG